MLSLNELSYNLGEVRQRPVFKFLYSHLVVRILLFYIVGILFCNSFHVSFSFAFLALGIGCFFTILSFFVCKQNSRKQSIYFLGVSSCFLFFSFGLFVSTIKHEPKPDFAAFNKISYLGWISDSVEERENYYKTTLTIVDTSLNEQSKILVYLEKDSLSNVLSYGDLVVFSGRIEEIKQNGNPMEFDYAAYMECKGIYGRAYIKSGYFEIVCNNFVGGIIKWANALRNNMLAHYKNMNLSQQEYSILAALTLGYKSELDQETIKAFQYSGAMHVLAVSGLHVGIILLISNLLLKFLDTNKTLRIIKCLITIVLIWCFAAITGFSSSVMRASLMFSLMSIGSVIGRKSSVYAAIGSSALIILIINPFTLFNIGFGLSYLAVIAIVAMSETIEQKFKKLNWFLKYFAQLLAISLVAQLATCFLSMRCFNIFPVYFLFANPIVIPLAYIIMILAVVSFPASYVAVLFKFISYLLGIAVKIMAQSVEIIQSIPGAIIDNIFLSNITTFLLYLALFGLFMFYTYKKSKYIVFALYIVAFVSILFLIEQKERHSDGYFAVYNYQKNLVLQVSDNSGGYILTDVAQKKQSSFFTDIWNRPSALIGCDYLNIKMLDSISHKFSDVFYQIGNKSFAVLCGNFPINHFPDSLKIDCLVMVHGSSQNVDLLQQKFKPTQIVISSSCFEQEKEVWKNGFKKLGTFCHDVTVDGAFVYGCGSKIVWHY